MHARPLLWLAVSVVALFGSSTAVAKPPDKVEHGKDACAKAPKLGKPGKGKDKDEERALRCLSRSGAGPERADFDGNGHADLAVGVPDENVGSISNAGAVDIVYGGDGVSDTLLVTDSQHLTQGSGAGDNPPEAEDKFGSSLAAGDFNADGFDDLAVGVPFEDLRVVDAGIVQVFYGSALGLQRTNPSGTIDIWSQNSSGVPDSVEAGDQFGFALTWGNFARGPQADLVVGAPGEGVVAGGVNHPAAGAVNTIYGSASGLTGTGSQFFTAETTANPGDSEAGDRLGAALTAADFGSTIDDDLVIGVPFEDVGTVADAGVVNVIFATSTGLATAQRAVLSQFAAGEALEAGDTFGAALTAGDFDGKALEDLAVGAPLEDTGAGVLTRADAGAVSVIYSGGVTSDQTITQATPDVDDQPEAGDRFGAALAANNFDSGGPSGTSDDLAIGAPLEDVAFGGFNRADAGAVNLVKGSASGITGADDQFLTQDSPGVPGDPERGDQFGTALSAWNFGADSRSDLAVGVPFEDVDDSIENTELVDVGVVDVIYRVGFNLDSGQEFTQSDLLVDPAERGDHFGMTLY